MQTNLAFKTGSEPHFYLGIVGHEAAKFTAKSEKKARESIYKLIDKYRPTAIVSGHCHLGGADIFAEEIAKELGLGMIAYTPIILQWNPNGYGYKSRNIDIAITSDVCANIVVNKLPNNYKGMRFNGCHHCKDRRNNGIEIPEHVKSGGCWTTWRCKRREWIIIEQEE